jgi:hypothetical protein
VEAAGAGFLALVATAGSLAETGANATADAALGVLRAFCRLEIIQLHVVLRVP